MGHWQTILILRGSAGKISLFARETEDAQWEFYRSIDPTHNQTSEIQIVYTFHDALSLLGASWKYLTPEYVHPAFKQQCWALLSKQTGMFDRVNWRKACI